MYFATDTCKTKTVRTKLMDSVSENRGLNWFALIDGAFDFGKTTLGLRNERFHTYDCDGMSDFLAASPYLLPLTTGDEACLEAEISTLIRHRRERPMLSFMATNGTAGSINNNLRVLANPLTEDDQELILRFADTRVLLTLPLALRSEYWNGLVHNLTRWTVIDREGLLQELAVGEGGAPLTCPFRLSPVEFASLLSNSEPDIVIDAIVESNPEAIVNLSGSQLHKTVVRACELAKNHNVTSFPDVVALAYLGILNEGNALSDPKLSDMLSRSQWRVGCLIDELTDFLM